MQHDGTCGHCLTSVPPAATACTGCGAAWRTGRRGGKRFLAGGALVALGIALVFSPVGRLGPESGLGPLLLGALVLWWGTRANRRSWAWYR